MADGSSRVSLAAACAIVMFMARFACAQSAPPRAPPRPVTDDYFGTKIVDNYGYFEIFQVLEVQQWMKVQADYTRATLDALPGAPRR